MHRLLCFLALGVSLHADTVLVLPFFNQSKTANLDWIGESIAATLHDALASQSVLALDREDRLEAYRRLAIRPGALLTRASIIKVWDALDAAVVICGQYDLKPAAAAASRGSLQITARVIDLKHTRQGPEFGEVGALEDLAA